MSGPFRFVFTLIWFAIGLGMIGTLKDCTSAMGKEAAIAHQQGGISYGWWNRQLLSGGKSLRKIPQPPKASKPQTQQPNSHENDL